MREKSNFFCYALKVYMLATNSVMGGVLQLIDMAIIGLIWFPFLKVVDKANLRSVDLSTAE